MCVKQIEIKILKFKQYMLLVTLLLPTETVDKMRHASYNIKIFIIIFIPNGRLLDWSHLT